MEQGKQLKSVADDRQKELRFYWANRYAETVASLL
jgi:hypothetical protein